MDHVVKIAQNEPYKDLQFSPLDNTIPLQDRRILHPDKPDTERANMKNKTKIITATLALSVSMTAWAQHGGFNRNGSQSTWGGARGSSNQGGRGGGFGETGEGPRRGGFGGNERMNRGGNQGPSRGGFGGGGVDSRGRPERPNQGGFGGGQRGNSRQILRRPPSRTSSPRQGNSNSRQGGGYNPFSPRGRTQSIQRRVTQGRPSEGRPSGGHPSRRGQQGGGEQGRRPGGREGGGEQGRRPNIPQILRLTREQAGAFHRIHEGAAERERAIRGNSELTEDEKRERLARLRREREEEIRDLLDDEQYQRLLRHRAHMRRQNGGNEGGGRPGGGNFGIGGGGNERPQGRPHQGGGQQGRPQGRPQRGGGQQGRPQGRPQNGGGFGEPEPPRGYPSPNGGREPRRER